MPNHTGTLRILFKAIVVIAIAQISIIKWLIPKLYCVIPPTTNQSGIAEKAADLNES
jgi:hypothetical protein